MRRGSLVPSNPTRFVIRQSSHDLTAMSGHAFVGVALRRFAEIARRVDPAFPVRMGWPASHVLTSYIGLLVEGKSDFDAIEALLSELAESTPRAVKKRKELLEKIRVELKAHTSIEEEIFYPAFKEKGSDSDDAKMYFEAMEEHRAAGDLVLPDLLATDADSEKFSGRAKVLKELVKHHADEEEKEMFPRAKKLLSQAELTDLGERMASRKSELVKQLKA